MDKKKKTLRATERNEEARTVWRESSKHLDVHNLVVIDECGVTIGLTPLYTRPPKGQRACGTVPRNRGKDSTLLAALTFEGMGLNREPFFLHQEMLFFKYKASLLIFERVHPLSLVSVEPYSDVQKS